MEFIEDKLYTYRVVAGIVAQEIIRSSHRVIGITGTSSVGKSTFSRTLRKKLEIAGCQVQIISADNYLKSEFRAGHRFWNRKDSTYLKPEHFDWESLRLDVDRLFSGETIEKECYIRGTGWGNMHVTAPAQIYLIDGLFLDSLETSKHLDYDFLISLTAEDRFIRSLRIKRDAYYRKTSDTFSRTEEETLLEIENTLRAGKAYTPYTKWKQHLVLHVERAFHAKLSMKN